MASSVCIDLTDRGFSYLLALILSLQSTDHRDHVRSSSSDLSEIDTLSAGHSEKGSVGPRLKRQNARSDTRDLNAEHAVPEDLVFDLFDAIDGVNEKMEQLRAAVSAHPVYAD